MYLTARLVEVCYTNLRMLFKMARKTAAVVVKVTTVNIEARFVSLCELGWRNSCYRVKASTACSLVGCFVRLWRVSRMK